MVKLGKLPAKQDSRTLRLSRYFMPQLPEPPEKCEWSKRVPDFPMYANDEIGDCAIAGPAHQVQTWTHNDDDSPDFNPTDEQVISGYSRCGGFVPGNPATDNGCVMLDVMKIWRHEGLFGRKIGAFASVEPLDHQTVCQAIWLFGGLSVGLSLPLAAMGMRFWDAPSGFHRRRRRWQRGSWGGHEVQAVDYGPDGIGIVTWGGLMLMSWSFLDVYCDELFAAISPDWLGADGKAPNEFDGASLLADLQAIR